MLTNFCYNQYTSPQTDDVCFVIRYATHYWQQAEHDQWVIHPLRPLRNVINSENVNVKHDYRVGTSSRKRIIIGALITRNARIKRQLTIRCTKNASYENTSYPPHETHTWLDSTHHRKLVCAFELPHVHHSIKQPFTRARISTCRAFRLSIAK